jgi:hypothetical protein
MKREPAVSWRRVEGSPQAAELSRVGEQELAMLLAKRDTLLTAWHHRDLRRSVTAGELALRAVPTSVAISPTSTRSAAPVKREG